jgi:hypothetical protein
LVPEVFGERATEALRAYFPRWNKDAEAEVLRIGFIDRFQVPVGSWESVMDRLLVVEAEWGVG